ncbi:MAG TPA: branched-chain amino acid ABC transporter ATP-binding protein/permease [Geminicoccaceae bacterium]|nr:branched-chain amino acid ABC transporter ATP-binding protein/permease [Geminicoccaceae bacterium]
MRRDTLLPLLLVALSLVLVPPFLLGAGLTLTSATDVVIFAIAALGLNLLVGYTGLVSFGHGAWFGLGAYAAALFQRHLLPGQMLLPGLLAVLFVAVVSLAVGFLLLRRRGVYFSLMTLAFTALLFAIAFRWSEFTGGESGLGGVIRRVAFGIDLADPWAYLVLVSLVGLAVAWFLLRVVHSPLGTVLVAIRENEQRARFQGYATNGYKLRAFLISATVTGLAGVLFAFHHRFVSADPLNIPFSGELLAMVVIGGMHSFLGPALGALFYMIFRELLSIWTPNWLLYFGLLFVVFVIFSPEGLVGVGRRLLAPFRKEAAEAAAMAGRTIEKGAMLPAFLREAAAAPTNPVLDCRGLVKRFGGLRAVDGVDLAVRPTSIHALLGPNGAGKTTAFNLISGMFPPNEGEIRLFEERIDGHPAEEITQRGLARSFQITNLYTRLTIEENIRLGLQGKHERRTSLLASARRIKEINRETAELLAFLGLKGIEQARADSLSYGGQRLVDMGMALSTRPKILLLDEPLAGLAAAERERIVGLIRTIAQSIPVLIVEHDIDRVFGFADEITVMNQGALLIHGTVEEVRTDRRVQEVYIGSGTEMMAARPLASAAREATLLTVDKVNTFYGKSHILNDASLTVHEGEIVGLLGRNGAGKSTLLRTLIGIAPPRSGSIRLGEHELAGLPSAEIARLGIGYVPQGRGMFAGMSVRDNLELGRIRRRTGHGIHWDEETILTFFPRLKERLGTPADYLSGGEQQMAAVARALIGDTRLLLLDEPFEGLAPAVVEELFEAFDRLRNEVSIIIVEHNLDLVLALADRAYVLERGTVVHEGPARPLLHDLDLRRKVLWL